MLPAFDACSEANSCDNDENNLAQCVDEDMGNTCNCQYSNLGIFYDEQQQKCTTGTDTVHS